MNHSEFIRITENKKTAVVFVHGIMGTPRYFDDMIPYVPESWAIYNILLDGHGKGFSDFAHTSKKKWREQIEKLIVKLEGEYENIVFIGHSLGTLLLCDAYEKHPDKVKALILFACPLKLFLKPSSAINSFKVIFNIHDEDNPVLKVSSKTHSVPYVKNLFRYLTWLPRYFDLFSLVSETRKKIINIKAPCYTFFSKKDEMVSIKSMKYFEENKNVTNYILEKSWHYYYDPEDFSFITKKLTEIFKKRL